jgi:hypothetical protein
MAEIEATGSTSSKLRNMLEGIEIDISASGSRIKAETLFGKELTVLLESFKGFTEKFIDYGSKIRISYHINIPEYVDIKIKNQFGDITMQNNTGMVSVDLSNGDFKANSLNRLSEFNFDFGEAEIGSVKDARIVTTFSKFYIKEAGELSVNSTGSRYELGRTGRLNLESRRDKFFIEDASGLGGASYFSDFRIERLTGQNILTLKYGSFETESVDRGFEKIDISSAYSDITLSFEPSSAFSFRINHTNAFVVIPEKNTRSEKKSVNEEKKEFLITGSAGNDPGGHEVRIDASRGNIYLKN